MTTIYQGEVRDLVFAVSSASGQPQDLAGASVVWRLQRSQSGSGSGNGPGGDSQSEVLQKSATVSNTTLGQAVVALDSDDTDLAPGTYWHELRVSLGGAVATVFQGRLTVARSLFS
jgi:hypothetical protein